MCRLIKEHKTKTKGTIDWLKPYENNFGHRGGSSEQNLTPLATKASWPRPLPSGWSPFSSSYLNPRNHSFMQWVFLVNCKSQA